MILNDVRKENVNKVGKKLTTEEINKKLEEQGNGIRLLNIYTGKVREYQTFICKDGHTWKGLLEKVKTCQKCGGPNQKLYIENINKRLYERNIKLIGEYKGDNTEKLKFQCEFNHIWESTINSVCSSKTGCHVCNHKIKLTTGIINKRIEDRKIKLIEDYKGGAKIKHNFQCSKNHIWEATVDAVCNNGTGCPECYGNKQLTTEIVIERLLKQGKGIILVGEYKGKVNLTHTFQCKNGHTWKTGVDLVCSAGTGCPECHEINKRLDCEKINNKIEARGIKLIEDYKGSNRLTHKFECKEGHIWKTSLTNVYNCGTGCPKCSISGFKADKPAQFYVYHLKNSKGKEVLGFGITNVFKDRNYRHQKTFRDNNIENKLQIIFNFENGYDVVNLENNLKILPYIINFGIEGFRSESLPLSFRYYINSLALQYGGTIQK